MKRPLAAVLCVLAAPGLLVCGASAAHAADDETVVYTDTLAETNDDVSAYFTTVDPLTLDETVLSSFPYMTNDEGIWLTGLEVYGGTGYAIRGIDGGEEDIFTWDIATGEQDAPVQLNYTDAGFFDAEVGFVESWALDTTPDGRVLAIGFFDTGEGGDSGEGYRHAVIEIDPATGVITPVVDFSAALLSDTYWYEGLATDPSTGTTYLLGYHYEDGAANQYPAIATPVDIDANTVGSPVTLPAYPSVDIDDINEGDFDDSGVLYLLSDDGVLGTMAAPLETTSAFTNLGTPAQLSNNVLAVTGNSAPAEPQDPSDSRPTLAATGTDTAPLALGAASLLVLGGLAVAWAVRNPRRLAVHRRRRRG